MVIRACILIAILGQLSACIVTPRFEMAQTINFDYVPPVAPIPLSYSDLLCCYDCTA